MGGITYKTINGRRYAYTTSGLKTENSIAVV